MAFSNPATYKKKAGTLRSADDEKSIQWNATGGDASKNVVLGLSEVSNMNKSPASSAKNILKVVTIQNGEEVNYMFSFGTRELLDETTQQVGELVRAHKAAEQKAKEDAEKAAAAEASNKKLEESIKLDTKSLLANLQLQKKFLNENKELGKTFTETVIKGKGGISPLDFWGERITLLRSFAFAQSQKRGRYNVLSTIRPTAGDNNQLNVSLSREKIHDIFEQYPIVRQAYNDTVPTISEGQFWARFFNSRLYRKLKGEKINPNDAMDAALDKYLSLNEEAGSKRRLEQEENYHVPQYLNVEGNVENQPETYGNRPDLTMRAGKSGTDTLSLMRSFNHLSERMLFDANRAKPIDMTGDSEPIGPVDNYDDYMKLSDLDEDEDADDLSHSVRLKMNKSGNEAIISYNKEELRHAQTDMKSALEGQIDLKQVSANHEEVVASKEQVNQTIRLRAKEALYNVDSNENWGGGEMKLLDEIQSCHATSTEFLRHFWIHFQSGDPNQALALSKLVPALERSIERVDDVVKRGSTESDQQKIKTSLGPLVVSLRLAIDRYQKEMAKQSAIP